MYRSLTILMLFVAFCAASSMQAAAIDDFKSAAATAQSEHAVSAIIQAYLPKLKTVDDLRELQNVWQQADPQACNEYFSKAAAQEPQSAMYQYLNLRFEADKDVQMAGARKLCTAHPDFYWGYRLVCVNFSEMMLKAEKESAKPLAGQEAVLSIIDKGTKNFPDDPYLNMCQFHRYRIAKDNKKAEKYLLKVNDPTALTPNWEIIKGFIVETKNMSLFDTVFQKIIDAAVAKGELDEEKGLSVIRSQKLELYEQMGNWDAVAAVFQANESLKDDPTVSTYYDDLLMARNNHAELLNRLSANVEIGGMNISDLKSDTRYKPLYENTRWKALLVTAQQKWEADAPARKAEALKDRINTPAPLWELPDANGKIVKLADLKGQVVVLDFWATWCGPCRMAMPALDGWMKTKMPANVKVCSINVWENAVEKAKQYFVDNGFAMTLLFAENSISKEYGFNGIPYICVIDKQGNVAYAQSGYSETLEDNLGYWTEALTQE